MRQYISAMQMLKILENGTMHIKNVYFIAKMQYYAMIFNKNVIKKPSIYLKKYYAAIFKNKTSILLLVFYN